ncbi:DNA helicase [Variovorax sp. RHLX14]|uniref:DNA helicase n=1 Tax=Variovorax sp. RHLX14 TaxID=1259731 RepID=UPI003F46C7EE
MKLSVPVHRLKRLAKELSRGDKIPLHAALDRIAQEEGFATWSLLASRLSGQSLGIDLLARLEPGDLVLVGSRPHQGKTMKALELVVQAVQSGQRGWFFSLEWTLHDLLRGLEKIGTSAADLTERFEFDCTDALCARYIIERLADAPRGSVVVIDYLQLLDQKREHPALAVQVRALKDFADDRGLIVVMLSQIDRSFDPGTSAVPTLGDVRLPNPLDLLMFDKACFLHDGAVEVLAVS